MERTSDIKNKEIYIELLRIIALYFVMFQHTVDRGATLFYSFIPSDVRYYICLLISIIDDFAVPVFLMISGANLLGRHESVKKQAKRILRMCIVLFVFEVFYYWENTFVYGDGLKDTKQFFINMYTSNINGFHLWYMYAYLCFLIIMPFLRLLVKEMESKQYRYLFVIALFFNGIVPWLEFTICNSKFQIYSYIVPVQLVSNIVLYPLLGYYFANNKITKKEFGSIVALTILGWILVIVSETRFRIKYDRSTSDINHIFVMLTASCVFIGVKVGCLKLRDFLGNKKKAWLQKVFGVGHMIVINLGSATFGAYLIHIRLMHVYWDWYYTLGKIIQEPLFLCLIWVLIVQMIGLIMVLLFKKALQFIAN